MRVVAGDAGFRDGVIRIDGLEVRLTPLLDGRRSRPFGILHHRFKTLFLLSHCTDGCPD